MENVVLKKRLSVDLGQRRFRFLFLIVLLVFAVRSPIRAVDVRIPGKVDPEKYLGLSEKACLSEFRKSGLKWSETKSGEGMQKGFRNFILSSSGFDIFCMAGYVVEVTLYGPDAKNNGFQGVMYGILSWGDTLSTVKKKMGKPQHEEDVADHDAYYVGYERKGRRVILGLTRKAPHKLNGIRIQAIP